MGSSFEPQAFADQLSIDTPEQVALELPVAGVGSRFVAVLVDHLLQGAVLLLLALGALSVWLLAGRHGAGSNSLKWFSASAALLTFLVLWGYFALFETFWRGQTPGKRLMRLRVIKDTGRQVTGFEAMTRNLLRVADLLPALYLAGVVTMVVNRRNKRLGDLAAGTLVVHDRAAAQPLLWSGTVAPVPGTPAGEWRPHLASFTPELLGSFAPDAVARLSQRDLLVLESFFTRALELPLETRAAVAQRMLLQMCEVMGVEAPAGPVERSLEELATALRRGGPRRP